MVGDCDIVGASVVIGVGFGEDDALLDLVLPEALLDFDFLFLFFLFFLFFRNE